MDSLVPGARIQSGGDPSVGQGPDGGLLSGGPLTPESTRTHEAVAHAVDVGYPGRVLGILSFCRRRWMYFFTSPELSDSSPHSMRSMAR